MTQILLTDTVNIVGSNKHKKQISKRIQEDTKTPSIHEKSASSITSEKMVTVSKDVCLAFDTHSTKSNALFVVIRYSINCFQMLPDLHKGTFDARQS